MTHHIINIRLVVAIAIATMAIVLAPTPNGVQAGSPLPLLGGCTDPLALNYDPFPDTEDGSCVYPINLIAGGDDNPSGVSIAAKVGDRFFAVRVNNSDGNGTGIAGQLFDVNDVPLSSNFILNEEKLFNQYQPDVAYIPTQRWVAAWTSDDGSGNALIFLRLFNLNGLPTSGDIQVNEGGSGLRGEPALCVTERGKIAITWTEHEGDGSGQGIYMRYFHPNGTAASGEFRINDYTLNDQYEPAVAPQSGGGVLATWTSDSQDGDGGSIVCRYIDEEGALGGSEFVVNTNTAGDQVESSIAVLSNGRSVVVWASNDGDQNGVYCQIFLANGTRYLGEVRVNEYTAGDQHVPNVVADTSGGCVIFWSTGFQDGNPSGVYCQAVLSNGTASGPQFRVSGGICNSLGGSDAAVLSSDVADQIVAVWGSNDLSCQNTGVFSRRIGDVRNVVSGCTNPDCHNYHPNATIHDGSCGRLGPHATGDEFMVNSSPHPGWQRDSSIAGLNGGDYVIIHRAWRDGDRYGIFAQRHSAANQAVLVPEFQVNTYSTGDQYQQIVTPLSDGGFVVVFMSPHDGNGQGLFSRQYNATTDPLFADEMLVTDFTNGDQQFPAASGFHSGGYVVSFTSNGNPGGNGRDIYVRRFGEDGLPIGVEFRANNVTSGEQGFSAIAVLPDDSFIVAWDDNPDGNGDVYARHFSMSGSPLTDDFLVNTDTAGKQTIHSRSVTGSNEPYAFNPIGVLPSGEFAIGWVSDGTAYMQLYSSSVEPVGSPFVVADESVAHLEQRDISILGLKGGQYAALFTANTNSYDIYTQVFDAFGNRLGSTSRVNTYTSSYQNFVHGGALANGGYVAAWDSHGQDGAGAGVFAQQFDASC